MTPDCRLCPDCQRFKPLDEFASRNKHAPCLDCRTEREIAEAEREIRSEEYRYKYKGSYRGFIYVIYSPTGAYKIGRSANIEDRMNMFSVPGLKLVHSFYTWHSTVHERMLHYIFKHRHIEREWFALTEDDLSRLKAIGERVGRIKQDNEYITHEDHKRLAIEISEWSRAEQRRRNAERKARRLKNLKR